ncbi:hypothetical protein [Nocardioides dilutus]
MTSHRAAPGLLIAVLVAVALASIATTVLGLRRDPAPQVDHASEPKSTTQQRPEVEAAAVLAAWDADRSAAWAAGDVRRLRSLYTPGSVAGERDIAMLRRWLERGLIVTDLRTQVLALRELRRSSDHWVLEVTDRLVDGLARDGTTTRRLPADSATTRTVALRLVGGRWLVSSVR